MYQLIIHHDTGLSKQDQQFVKDGLQIRIQKVKL
jgi:hypothetical protein